MIDEKESLAIERDEFSLIDEFIESGSLEYDSIVEGPFKGREIVEKIVSILSLERVYGLIKRGKLKEIISYSLLSLLTLIVFFPILYALGASFMDSRDIVMGKIIPETFSLANYRELYEKIPMMRFFLNSIGTSLLGMVLQLITCSLSAYAVVFMEFKSKKLVYSTILLSMFIPWEAIFIPNYLTILNMGLLNSKTAVVLPFVTSGLGVFLMVQQFKGLNKALIEAAKIDGCNDLFIYTKIVLPLSKSVLGTWGVFSFLSMWNMYLWPLMTSTRPESRTIQIGLKMMRVQEGVNNYGVLMAGVIMVIVPSLIVLFFGQKQLQKGMTAGGVKE